VIKSALGLLGDVERSRIATSLAVSSLSQAGVIKPWPITVKTEQGDRTIDGLHGIDEAALNALPTEGFDKLRATRALPIAYGQMFSMGQIHLFEQLSKIHAQAAPKPVGPLPDTLDKLFDTGNNEYLRFD
jgi:hypothetical protein